MKCQRERCKAAATHGVKALIPARGHAWERHTPLSVMVGIKLCAAHANQPGILECFSAESKQTISECMRAIGRVDPDFSRAKAQPILLSDPEYLKFEALQATKQ